MSLRTRLSVIITLLFLLVSALGVGLVIRNARQAVHQELESTANLAIQLLGEIARTSPVGSDPRGWDWFQRVNRLDNVRHLCISILDESGATSAYSAGCEPTKQTQAPAWFVNLLTTESIRFSQPLATSGAALTSIIVHADPADEIDEVWKEARVLIGLIILCALIANGVVFFVMGAAMRPLTVIQTALGQIEHGDFRLRLPEFRLPEIAALANHVNSMAHALEKRTREVGFLTQKSLDIQEDERRILARELHDELGQSVAAIMADAASIKRINKSHNPLIDESADAISEVCARIYAVVKQMMSRLRPGMLDELGLESALRDHVEDWRQRHAGIEVRLNIHDNSSYNRDPHSIHVYRIIQEALTNIAKHSDAERAEIDLSLHENGIELRIGDNGRGFEAHSTEQGLGLLGMRERVESLGGSYALETQPEQGTVITVTIP